MIKTLVLSTSPALWCGLAILAWVGGGCGNREPGGEHASDGGLQASSDHPPGEAGGHHHGSVHGGVAVELGEHEFHLDVALDRAQGVLSVWVMDAHVENFVRLPATSISLTVESGGLDRTLALAAVANPSTGETVGDTSQFRGEAGWLKEVTAFRGVVESLEIRGRTYRQVRFEYPVGKP